MLRSIIPLVVLLLLSNIFYSQSDSDESAEKRNMTFLDVRKMKRSGSYAISLDKKWMLYTVTVPDWETAEDQSDIHLVSMTEGVSSHKQMTYTDEVSEKSPKWSIDGSYFVFLSQRDDKKDQIYMVKVN